MMDKLVIADYNVYEDNMPSIEINGIDINTIYYYSIHKYYGNDNKYINSKKMVLTLCQCSGQCTNNNERHLCKLARYSNNELIANCPYAYKLIDIKEPKTNSQSYILWHYIEKFLNYRKHFGKYASYLSLNDEFNVDDQLYSILKKIPEFSLKNAFDAEYDLEEYKDKILNDKKYEYYLHSSFHVTFFTSLLQHYRNEIERHRQFLNCQLLLDKDTAAYVQWKEHQDNPLVDIGDYYFITESVYRVYNLPSFLHYNTKIDTKYISFLKTDIQLVYNYLKHNQLISGFQYYNKFLLETIENLIEENKKNEKNIDTG